jgi:hypothetical protein
MILVYPMILLLVIFFLWKQQWLENVVGTLLIENIFSQALISVRVFVNAMSK